MPKFSDVGGEVRSATAVSLLLNANNRLTVVHTADSILNSNINYILLYDVPPHNNVIGCVGVCVQGEITVLKHLSVAPQYRRQGYGMCLITAAINSTKTKVIRAFVRSDNTASLCLFEAAGFMAVGWKQITPKYRLIAVEKQI